MAPLWRGGAAISLSLAFHAPALGLPNPPDQAAGRVSAAAPSASSGVSAATSTRVGVLANGLRYAILRTANASGKVALRLRVAVGSLSETDAERGFAQLLARAPFDGTRPAPGGELGDVAKAHGLSFTADGNADARADATTFSLDLATADPSTLETAVALLRGAAGEPKLAQSDVDAEWATVVAHEHASNDLANRVFRARLAFLLEGQRPAAAVGGLGDTLVARKVKRGPVAAFHARFYRPDRAVLVVAGDVDVEAVEKEIRTVFGSWRAAGAPGVDPDPGSIEQRGMQARVRVEPGAPTSVQLSWISAADRAPDTPDKRRQDAIERLALGVLNRRLAALADSDDAPVDSAAAFQETLFGAARVSSLLLNARPGRWRDALAAADQTQRGAIAFAPTADELAAARAAVDADLSDSADTANTRPPALIADVVASDLAAGEAITTPAEDLAAFDAATAGVTADQVTAALKDTFTGQGPLLFVSSPTVIDGGDAAVAGAFAAIHAQPVAAPAPQSGAPTFRDFGEPGKIAQRRDVIDLDTVFVRFENGVRLTIRPTKLEDGEVSAKVRVGGGLMALPADRTPPIWALPTLADGTPVKIASEDDALTLTGVAARDDLDLLMRALAAPLVAADWRQDAFDRLRNSTAAEFAKEDTTATGVFRRAFASLSHDGDRRWTRPDGAEAAAGTLAEARRSFGPLLANGRIEVIVVGDITEDKALDAAAATFGALPARPTPATTVPLAAPAPIPSSAPVVLTHKGAGDDGLAAIVWPTDDFFADPREARIVEVLTEVLRARLANAGVAPHADSVASMALPHVGFTRVYIQGTPARLDSLLEREASAAGDLRAQEVGSDELARAEAAIEQTEETARRSNAHWLDLLSGAQDDPRRLAAVRSHFALLERVTPADIRAAAQRYLRPDTAIRLEVRPAGS